MDALTQLRAVLEVFERLEIDVRQEHLGGTGGSLCALRNRRVLFVDLDADAATRVENCIEELAKLPEASSLYIPPEIRERVDKVRGR